MTELQALLNEVKRYDCWRDGGMMEAPEGKYVTHKDLLALARQRDAKREDVCEHCGSNRIYSGPPACPMCGAPICCQTCCKITTLENDLLRATAQQSEDRKTIEGLRRTISMMNAPDQDTP
jgi:hypothetical protein